MAKVRRTCDGGDTMNKKFDASIMEEEPKIVRFLLYTYLIEVFYYYFYRVVVGVVDTSLSFVKLGWR